MTRQAIRKGLFRAAMTLKIMTWAAIAAALVIGFRDVAKGRELTPPSEVLYAIGALLLLQLLAVIGWRLAREPK